MWRKSAVWISRDSQWIRGILLDKFDVKPFWSSELSACRFFFFLLYASWSLCVLFGVVFSVCFFFSRPLCDSLNEGYQKQAHVCFGNEEIIRSNWTLFIENLQRSQQYFDWSSQSVTLGEVTNLLKFNWNSQWYQSSYLITVNKHVQTETIYWYSK